MKSAIYALPVAFAMTALPAAAQDRTKVGTLDCIIEGGFDIAIITSKELSCTFQPADQSQPPESYIGAVETFGLDVGSTSESVMRWLVLARTADAYSPGALAGTYVGASAQVTAGVGAGANILVSKGQETLMLQPVSLEAQTGLNLAAGVTEFHLDSTEM